MEKHFYNNTIKVELPDDLTHEQCMAIAGYIYGDVGFRKPSMEQARIYKEAGANVYMYLLDIDFPIDMLLQRKCPYGVGHDAVFRTDSVLYHKFENMVIFRP